MPVKWNRAVLALLLTVAGLTMLSCGAKNFRLEPLDDDEDRPPIIVKNGSIDFLALPVVGGAGKWESSGVTNQWKLTHETNQHEGKHFDVSVFFGASAACKDDGGKDAGYHFEQIVRLTYTDSMGQTAKMEMIKPQGQPRTTHVTATGGTASGPLLSVLNDNVYVTQIVAFKNDSKYYTCTFDPYLANVIVFQRTK